MTWTVRVRTGTDGFGLDVSLEDQSVIACTGPNGAGKSTLLRAIVGGIPVAEAFVEVDGVVWEDTAHQVRLPVEQRRAGYVPQRGALFAHLSVLENVAFGLPRGPGGVARAREELAGFGIEALAGRRPGTLSGGEQQRVALARAFARDPALLLLDEPFAALDAATRRALRAELPERLAARGLPAIVVSHDVRDLDALGAPVVVLEAGEVCQAGRMDELREAPATAYVAELVGR